MQELIEVFKTVVFNNYANFKGRASRKEFWLYFFMQYLYMMTCMFVVYIIALICMMTMLTTRSGVESGLGVLIMVLVIYGGMFLVFLPILIPSLAVTVRRLHDTNRSGWWMLLGFVPLGGLFVLFFLVFAGDAAANAYGENPLSNELSKGE